MNLQGRVVLVTGGGTGLGRAIVLAAAAAGANVAINYSRSRDEAAATASEARALGVRAAIFQASVAEEPAVHDMFASVESTFGPVAALVNNAGVTRGVPFEDLAGVKAEDWRNLLDVNLLGAWRCSRTAALLMRERGEGVILNIASDSAVSLAGSSIPYVVSKAALVALTRCMARALQPSVRVNALAPGWMETRWLDANLAPVQREMVRSGLARVVSVDAAAAMGIELIRNEGITGQVVVLDGGDGLGVR